MTNIEQLAQEKYPIENSGCMWMPSRDDVNQMYKQEGFVDGFKTHQELVKDKLFNVDDIMKAIEIGEKSIVLNSRGSYLESRQLKENFIQSLLPKTEWDIKFNEQGKLELL
jgi:hypothetical protein